MIPDKKQSSYLVKANKRLVHIRSHIDDPEDVSHSINNIEKKIGNLPACVMSLSSHAMGSALCAWFEHRNLNALKQWWYVSAKLDQLWYQIGDQPFSPRANMLRLLKPLLSDENELIDWFSHYDQAYDMKRVEDHKAHDFFAYQSIVALQGDWLRLLKRCDKVLNDPPGASKEQKYLLDHHFYKALAQGDMGKMQSVLQELLSSKVLKARGDDENGFTEDLIFTPAVIYAKIAWRHGYEVKVDSPYVPAEWLPVEPLKEYDNHYDFLRI
jgi:hypothetical protein